MALKNQQMFQKTQKTQANGQNLNKSDQNYSLKRVKQVDCEQKEISEIIIIQSKMDYYKIQQIENYQNEQSSASEIEVNELASILEKSRKFIINFIDELKEKALTPISQDVLDYYNGKIQNKYQVKQILHITDKRISKMIRNKKIKKNWNLEDIILLLWFVSKYMALKLNLTCQTFSNQDWQYISKLIPGSSPKGCMFKFISLKKVKLSIFNWSQQEEKMLKQLVEKLGQNRWKQISQLLYENNQKTKIFRTPKQCRQHWNCYLDPKLKKGPWTENEDVKLLQNVRQNKGQRKWSSIKHLFEGRTQNALKNRYNLLLQRQKKITPNKNQNELIGQYLKGKSPTLTTINACSQSPNYESNSDQKSFKQSIQQQQIFQQPHEQQNKNQIPYEITENNIMKNAQILIKSQKSSFKLSQAFQRKVGLKNFNQLMKQKSSVVDKQFNSNGGFVFMNLSSIGSIFTNQHGFYTNILFKPASQSSQFYNN